MFLQGLPRSLLQDTLKPPIPLNYAKAKERVKLLAQGRAARFTYVWSRALWSLSLMPRSCKLKAGREAGKSTLPLMIFLRVARTMINGANHFLLCFLYGWQVWLKYGLLLPPYFMMWYRLSRMPSKRGVFPIKFKFQTVLSVMWYMPLSVMLISTVHICIP